MPDQNHPLKFKRDSLCAKLSSKLPASRVGRMASEALPSGHAAKSGTGGNIAENDPNTQNGLPCASI